MKLATMDLLFCGLALATGAAATFAADAPLADRLGAESGWAAYRVPKIADGGDPCCFQVHDLGVGETGCSLDGREWSFGTSTEMRVPKSDSLAVYVHSDHGRIDRVRALSASCPVHSAGTIRWLDAVAPADSIAVLSGWVEAQKSCCDESDNALAALAYHAETAATRVLGKLADVSHPRKLREQALFWLGQARGLDGAEIVERAATGDSDPKLREQAVFALSQSHPGDPYLRIRRISETDSNEHVRSQALFWMAQMDDPRANDDISARVRSDPSDEVREQAVFALSQLKDDQADRALIAVLQGDYPRKAKEHALFWLGQSGSPQALAYFDQALSTASK